MEAVGSGGPVQAMMTAIVSPEVLGAVLAIVLVGTGVMAGIVRHKYECTPEREKELEEAGEQDRE